MVQQWGEVYDNSMEVKMRQFLPLAMLLASGLAMADESSDRARLIGEWAPQDNSGATWVLRGDGETLHITEKQNDQNLADFECNTLGKECAVKSGGHEEKITMWYNGPELVVTETRGREVVRHRFHALDSDKMEIEVVPIVPDGKPHSVDLVRRGESASVKQ